MASRDLSALNKKIAGALPADVRYIIETLEENGFEAYAVGGCVRDSVMHLTPKDWDICTNALAEQTMQVFSGERIIETGLKHGTITLMRSDEPYEITTYRTDGDYSDNRRPDSVTFVRDLREDLSRRDFTINAMAYNPKDGIVDMFGGVGDIEDKLIRCVGDAGKRFSEDALRIMRALRFASRFGFGIEEETSAAIREYKELLLNISKERIAKELGGILSGCGVADVLPGYNDVVSVFIPEAACLAGFRQNNPHHHLDVWEHTLASVAAAPPDEVLRLTMFLHDIAKPLCYSCDDGTGHFYGHEKKGSEMAQEILRRLKYDNDTIAAVTTLILYHDADIKPGRKSVRRWLSRLGEETLRQLIEVKRADAMAQSMHSRQDKLIELDKIPSIISEILEQRLCFSLKDLAVNGRDLIDAGIAKGQDKMIGSVLDRLLGMVMDEEIDNEKDALLQRAAEIAEVSE